MNHFTAATLPQSLDHKADILLARLAGVRNTGSGKWLARCPAHDDRNPSLAVKLGHSGILIRCFAGCDLSAILAAVGLSMSDLFPDRPKYFQANNYDDSKPKVPKFSRYELFDTLCFEALILYLSLQRLRNGVVLTQNEWARIDRAMDVIGQLSNEVNTR